MAPVVNLTFCCFVVYSTRRFVFRFAWCCFVFVCFFFWSFEHWFTSLGEEKSNLSAFRAFVRFALVWFCLFHLPLGVWERLRFVIVALPGLFSYRFCLVLFCSCVFQFFSIVITSLGEDRAYLSAFRTFVRFALVWFCMFPLQLFVWKGLWLVIVALPGLLSYPLFF